MKNTLLATTLLLTVSLSAGLMAAPAEPRDGSMHQRGFERMAEELSLTDEQKAQLSQIREE
ncbi:MAG TPA: hypothetical protein DEA92_12535, partial [Pseudomonas sp.]|nr:hypothetical protein [Pseudomonas sp.]